MTIAQRIGAAHSAIEDATKRAQFLSVCKYLMLGKGRTVIAARIAEETGASPAVTNVLKAASSAVALSSLADFRLQTQAFLEGLSSYGLFDALLPFMVRVPLSSTVGGVSVIATAYVVSESSAKPVSRLSLTSGTVDPQKAHCVVVLSNEILKFSGPGSSNLIQRELSNACALAVDGAFVSILLAGVSAGTSSGSTAEAVRSDIAGMLATISADQTSKLFILATPLIVRMWAMMGATSSNGSSAFPNLGVSGGDISGVRVIPSDAVSAGMVILADAAAIAGNSDTVELSTLSEGSVMTDVPPNSPTTSSTNLVSLWQSDLSALRCERWWGCAKLRSNSVAAVSNASSYSGGMSPP